MRQVNPDEFSSYTIRGAGWAATFANWRETNAQWQDMNSGTLIGNRPNGSVAILDTK